MNTSTIFRWSISVALAGFLLRAGHCRYFGRRASHPETLVAGQFHARPGRRYGLVGYRAGRCAGRYPIRSAWAQKNPVPDRDTVSVSPLGSAVAPDVITFMIFRFIGGLAIGSVTAPLYISEIAPAESRGRLVALFQFNIVLGILIAYVANYLLRDVGGENAWRWMLGWVALPSLLFSAAVLFIPESPRWLLVKKGDETEAAIRN